jgi:tetratricopeptide (TPR) repeat protein
MKAIIVLFLFTGLTGFSQKKKEVKEADKMFKNEQYEEVLPLYRKFINMDANNMDYVYKYGGCLVMVTDKVDDALKLLLKAKEMGKNDGEISYFLGRAYEKKERYEEAISNYELFKISATKEDVKKLKVKKRIKACKKAQKKK